MSNDIYKGGLRARCPSCDGTHINAGGLLALTGRREENPKPSNFGTTAFWFTAFVIALWVASAAIVVVDGFGK